MITINHEVTQSFVYDRCYIIFYINRLRDVIFVSQILYDDDDDDDDLKYKKLREQGLYKHSYMYAKKMTKLASFVLYLYTRSKCSFSIDEFCGYCLWLTTALYLYTWQQLHFFIIQLFRTFLISSNKQYSGGVLLKEMSQ